MFNLPNYAKPLIAAGFFLGAGIGGFIDGILFHQILQLHNMLSNRFLPVTLINAEINMFWDGLFHACTLAMVLYGLVLLWQAVKRPDVSKSTPLLLGSIFYGAGMFNLIEGVIDHHLLKLHHVVQRTAATSQFIWDIAFLLSGIVLIAAGTWVIKANQPYSNPLDTQI